ncbi:uncharacterized protein LOC122403585 [Colletes gigas]|uniref:uncharacterized protein LOC122403585 n=1 Tax=Colletes gigas TaxID=935657 RepID=UPI001C9BB184|nr:uncharacterized protein LOC122403585 [Colletes gigas]
MTTPPGPFPSGSDALTVNRVAVKIPEFSPTDPELWFAMVENSLDASGVTTEATKFGYVLGALKPEYAAEVRDIILAPPAQPFTKLKAELIKRMGSSQEQKTRRLLEHEEIGDGKPSQFLRHLRSLGGTTVSEEILRILWVGRLPSNMQVVLATQRGVELDRVAELADAIADTMGPRAQVAEAVAGPSAPQSAGRGDFEEQIYTQIAQLTATFQQELAVIRYEMNSGPRSFEQRRNAPGRVRPRSRSRERRTQQRGGKCFYHFKFGANALRCESPCNWSASGNASGSR